MKVEKFAVSSFQLNSGLERKDPLIQDERKKKKEKNGSVNVDATKGMAFRWSERPPNRSNDSVDSTKLSPSGVLFHENSVSFPFLRFARQATSARLALIYWPDSATSSRSDIKPIKRGVTLKIVKVTDSFLTIASSSALPSRSFVPSTITWVTQISAS